MNRAERRKLARNANKENTRLFTEEQVAVMNDESYRWGVAFALLAAKDVLQLGELRVDRIRKRIEEYEELYFRQRVPFDGDVYEIGNYKGVEASAKRKSKRL